MKHFRNIDNTRCLALADFISNYGSWLFSVALYAKIYGMTKEPLSLGMSFCVSLVPQFLFSILSIKIPEKINKKHLLIYLDILRSALVPLCIIFSEMGSLLGILVVQFMCSSASSVFLVARNYIIRSDAAKREIDQQLSTLRYYSEIALVLGALTAGYLYSKAGWNLVVLIDSATFLASAFCILFFRYDETKDELLPFSGRVQVPLFNLKKVVQHIKGLRIILFSKFIFILGLGVLNLFPALLALKIYKLPEIYVGLYFTAIGVCSAIAAFCNSKKIFMKSRFSNIITFGTVAAVALAVVPWIVNPYFSITLVGFSAASSVVAFVNMESEILSCKKEQFKIVNTLSQGLFFLSILISVMSYSFFLTDENFIKITTIFSAIALMAPVLFLLEKIIVKQRNDVVKNVA